MRTEENLNAISTFGDSASQRNSASKKGEGGDPMKPTSLAWRNRAWSLYEQYCRFDELINPSLRQLLSAVDGKAFDDEFCYQNNGQVIIRTPLWLGFKSDRHLRENGHKKKPLF